MRSEENLQKHQIWPISVKMGPKLRKSTNHDQNLTNSYGGQNALTGTNSGIPPQCFEENSRKSQIWFVSLS